MLNFIYYPVSGIMWVWHWLFSHVLPDSPGGSGVAWALSVVFLVFTLRAILYKPFVKQVRTTRQMQEIQPQLQAIRKKYAKDRVKMTEEMQKLQKEHGFNPLLGCLPMLAQVPVFIGLFHVLRSFNRTGHGIGQLGMSPAETRGIGNYVFSADQVRDFLDARLFGVPLSAYITEPQSEWAAFVRTVRLEDVDFTRAHIVYLVIPLVILSSIATHMNSRASVARQGAAALENPQTAIMNKLALYVFPLGILVSGAFFPIAILLYWVSNNIWTYAQQHIVFGQIEKEDAAKKAAKQEKLKANAPKPGARPEKTKRNSGSSAGAVNGSSADDTPDLTKSAGDAPGEHVSDGTAPKPATNGARASGAGKRSGRAQAGSAQAGGAQAGATKAGSSPGGKPRPGQRPRSGQQRKRKRR